MTDKSRRRRLHSGDRPPDNREDFQRDRDRILYTGAFRRLAGTTQVAAASEGHHFHNRLTHTLEVAQIARRIAELRIREQPKLLKAVGFLDADVTEAGALAHDLGHPPFGHVGENALDAAVKAGLSGTLADAQGYEGNAQALRILTRLAVRNNAFPGLNLTVATLNAIIKYPWARDLVNPGKRHDKFGYFDSEQDIFNDLRQGYPLEFRTAEAEIMDWADEIAYVVHDLYDFSRAGLIPLERLSESRTEFDKFLAAIRARWHRASITRDYTDTEMQKAMGVLSLCPLDGHYTGSRKDRAALRSYSSVLIGQYVQALELCDPKKNGNKCITVPRQAKIELDVLKECTWVYVIEGSGLASIQRGHETVVKTLYQIMLEDATKDQRLLPIWAREELDAHTSTPSRVVADVVSGLVEDQALALYNRLTGHTPGSMLDTMMH